MRLGEFDEDDFYGLVEEGMEGAIDRVATLGEWAACKRAIARWVEKIDTEYDDFAQGQEHDREP